MECWKTGSARFSTKISHYYLSVRGAVNPDGAGIVPFNYIICALRAYLLCWLQFTQVVSDMMLELDARMLVLSQWTKSRRWCSFQIRRGAWCHAFWCSSLIQASFAANSLQIGLQEICCPSWLTHLRLVLGDPLLYGLEPSWQSLI